MLEIAQLKESILIEIPYSQFYFIGFIFVVSITFFLLSFKKRKRKLTPEQLAKKSLLSLDLKTLHPKEVAYSFTKNGYILVTAQNKERFLEIVSKLDRYKYQKDVPSFLDEYLQDEITKYIKETV